MIKKFGKYKVNTAATTKSSSWYYPNDDILRYGSMVLYTDKCGFAFFGWYIGKSPSGATDYMLTVNNGVFPCKLSFLSFNWTSALSTITGKGGYDAALQQLEDNRFI